MRKLIAIFLIVFWPGILLKPVEGQRTIFFSHTTSGGSGTCPFVDNFSGTGTLNSSWTSYSSGYAGSGLIIRSSGHASVVADGTLAASLVTGGCTFTPNQYAQAVISQSDGKVMLIVRGNSSGNGYGAYVNSSGVLILLLTGGGGTVLQTTSCTSVIGNTYKISITGSTITVLQNGTICGTITDSTYTSGLPGLFLDNAGSVAINTIAGSFQAN